jgi:transcriptional regulator with XRE-family HTH domain
VVVVGRPQKPNLRMRQLARALRRLRLRAGLTQEVAATRLHFSDKKMSRIENGQVPSYHELQAMLDLYGLTVSEWRPFMEMRERAKHRGWWLAHGLDDYGYVGLEHDACEVREVQIGYVPGLLQTADYLKVIFIESPLPTSPNEIDRGIAIRQRRQQRLIADQSLALHAIIDETVLNRAMSPNIMGSQLQRIVMMSDMPNVTIRVLPKAAGQHHGLNGSFIVLRFPEPEDADVGYVEHVAGSVQLEKEAEVRTCNLVFDHLSRLALSPEDSVDLIRRVADEL